MSTGQLLNRKCRVTIQVGSPVPGLWFQFDTTKQTFGQDTIIIENLRVKFTTEKHLGKNPNEAKILIYNMAEVTRKACQVLPLNVTLEVAYGSGDYALLFTGNIRHAESRHEKTEWVTELQIGDGARAFANARVNTAIKGAVGPLDKIKTAVKSLFGKDAKTPQNVEEALADAQAKIQNGISIYGLAQDVVSEGLDPTGMQWSIQDGQFQALSPNEVVDGNGVVTTAGKVPALIVSVDTGMIESPDYAVPKTLGKPPILKVKMLISAAVVAGSRPGRMIQIDSETVKGNFRVEDAKGSGDTHGHEWHMELTCKAL